MCGIFGCIGKMHKEEAYKCISQIAHRGPDALGVEQLEGAVFAHARLSILDVSDAANQPMPDITGRYWIVFNGEIYNYIELRDTLIEMGYQFKTQSDTEVILYAYIEWGEDFQDRCNGMWALAIWDNLEKRLFLSRDRFGVKPLFYYIQDNNFYFASEMKAFFPVMRIRKPNYKIFDRKQYSLYEATRECSIEGIYRFPAGSSAFYVKENLIIKKWWETLEHLIDVPENYFEQVELFRDLFIDSCKIRMRSDVPIGTALSGGVDSGSVFGAMSYVARKGDLHMCDNWQNAFVASMPGSAIDETADAAVAAGYVGIEPHNVIVTPDIGADELMRYLYLCEDPYTTSPVAFIQTYGAIRENGIKVTLDGHGADELFGGYGIDITYAMNDADNIQQQKMVVETYNNASGAKENVPFEKLVSQLRYADYERQVNIKNRDVWPKMDQMNRKLYIQSHKEMLPTLLRCYDRYSMANGVEIRMPFMDYRIVSFAFSIPWHSKIRNGYSKAIVRDMAAPFMSSTILKKKRKTGFNSPMGEWFNSGLREFLLDIVSSRDFIECDLVNPVLTKAMVGEFFQQKKSDLDSANAIWRAIVPYLWKMAVIDK